MLKKIFIIYLFSILFFLSSCNSLFRINTSKLNDIPFELSSNSSASYEQVIDYYNSLAESTKYVQVNTIGMTDAGLPLHEIIIDKDKDFDPARTKVAGKSTLFINNGIHPGEPCGIDACMMLARDLIANKELFKLLEKTVVVIIPVYNVGGAKNRNSTTRANQMGPEEYGFRGNSKNLDLNRDFIKCDSKNAQSFNKLFSKWSPEVFVDTHTSNGADYQHSICLIPTQKDKLAAPLSEYLETNITPKLFKAMASDGYDMTPYVYSVGKTPDEGIKAFPDFPRYSSGYAALHHSLSFMTETHMLKPFDVRVKSTYSFLMNMIKIMHTDGVDIQIKRQQAVMSYMQKPSAAIDWELDYDNPSTTTFKGYEAAYKPSLITGQSRLYYDRTKPTEKEITYYDSYKTTKSVGIPDAYIIPQGYSQVIDRLKWNHVKMTQLEKNVEFEVEMYYIDEYETVKSAYESHYLHYNVTVKKVIRTQQFYKGDYVVNMDQVHNRFILEMLEPEAPDSYFAWNFFDGILMQKEYFSSYVFEDRAVEILEADPDLKKRFLERKESDDAFAKNARAQLNFIYENSIHFEDTYKLYPIARVPK